MKNFKPLLSATFKHDMERKFPYISSPKLDGIRCVIKDGVALSRTLKPIPNKHIQSILGNHRLDGLDGEIIVGDPTDDDCFRNTTKVVMSHDKVEDFTYFVFDHTEIDKSFDYRFSEAYKQCCESGIVQVRALNHACVWSEEELIERENEFVAQGYEGLMLRDLQGRYKYGRSTLKEQILIKVKRFTDSDAIVLGYEEQERNENEKVINELGNSKRSSHNAGKTKSGTLGALIVKDFHTGVEFNIGTGLSASERQYIWDNQNYYLGQILKYKFFPVGVKDKPRHPVFLAWRSPMDM